MVEFSPFVLTSDGGGCVRDMNLVVLWSIVALGGYVDEL